MSHRPLGPLTDAELEALGARRGPILARHVPQSPYGMADRFEEQARRFAGRPFLIDGDRVLTYGEADAAANRVARAADALGWRRGDRVALVMENRAEFVTVMLGLLKRGLAVGLLNTGARGRALHHAVERTGACAVIAGTECLDGFAGEETAVPLYIVPDPAAPDAAPARSAGDFAALAAAQPDAAPDPAWRAGLVAEDVALLIFTSGTTGLPKASILSHMRWLIGGDVKAAMMELTEDDVFYCVLPMFHGAVIMSLLAAAIAVGGPLVIRRRFSASRFWDDVRRHRVTVCQYVGEICRYLMGQPPRPDDRDHTLRAMTGTSMSAELWPRFQARFGVPQIYEGWGATEGNTNLVNYEDVPGAVGRVPDWRRTNLRIVRYDVETGTHPRDADGWLIPCGPGEAGEAIARIGRDPNSAAGRFEGYTSPADTERKILRGAFAPGDEWWLSGDLLRFDERGHVFFVDRIGDTFRWKSENVSTQEVADALADLPGLEMMAVYGVQVPGQEGRAGMAALILQPGAAFDPDRLYRLAQDRLPAYARPLFVRIWGQPDFTASHKLRRVELQKQGYDPAASDDPLYVLDPERGTYAPLTAERLAELGIPPFERPS